MDSLRVSKKPEPGGGGTEIRDKLESRRRSVEKLKSREWASEVPDLVNRELKREGTIEKQESGGEAETCQIVSKESEIEGASHTPLRLSHHKLCALGKLKRLICVIKDTLRTPYKVLGLRGSSGRDPLQIDPDVDRHLQRYREDEAGILPSSLSDVRDVHVTPERQAPCMNPTKRKWSRRRFSLFVCCWEALQIKSSEMSRAGLHPPHPRGAESENFRSANVRDCVVQICFLADLVAFISTRLRAPSVDIRILHYLQEEEEVDRKPREHEVSVIDATERRCKPPATWSNV
ncbi:hypothetical protein BJ508DRAFT_313354 [Ascobolus immersus RN42]|uniref:Uncharacterized protein n=1 Tax=Ascobolus immersus RN42 TaxID=1160509 RepID=A0A3N4HLX3_ASCIM|nr:hypothetical protein BJ508DRAFT_313354 [Ascobolus immersus RN42]